MTEPSSAPKRWFRKAARGTDETTPWIVMGGVHLAVAAVVLVVIAVVLGIWLALRY